MFKVSKVDELMRAKPQSKARPDPDHRACCHCRKSRDRSPSPKCVSRGSVASFVCRARLASFTTLFVFVCRQLHAPFSYINTVAILTTHDLAFSKDLIDILFNHININPRTTTSIHSPWRDRTARPFAGWAKMATPHTDHGR